MRRNSKKSPYIAQNNRKSHKYNENGTFPYTAAFIDTRQHHERTKSCQSNKNSKISSCAATSSPIGLLIGGVDFSNLFLTLKNGANAPADGYASLAAAQAGGAVTLNLGLFINSIISFLIIASAIFMVVKALNTLKKQEAPAEEAPAEPSEEVLLLREIRDSLKK